MRAREGRSVTEEVLKDIKEISKYYRPTKCFIVRDGEGVEFPCGDISNYLSGEGLINARIKVCNERLGKCLSLREGDRVRVLEFRGAEVYVSKDDVEHVARWEKIGYLVTRKGEERTIKTPFEGDIVLIQEVPEGRNQRLRLYVRVR